MLVLKGATKKLDRLLFAAGGRVLYGVESNATLNAWDLDSGTKLWEYRIGDGISLGDLGGICPVVALATHPTSGAVYVAALEYGLHRVDPRTGAGACVSSGRTSCEVIAVEGGLIEYCWDLGRVQGKAFIRLWAEKNGRPCEVWDRPVTAADPFASFWTDGNRCWIPLNGAARGVHCVEVETRRPVYQLPSPNAQFRRLRLATPLLFGISHAAVLRWDTDHPSAPPLKVTSGNRKRFTDLAVHPVTGLVYATANDETVKVYDPTSLALSHSFTWKVGRMRSIAFSPDGTLAAAGSDTGKVVVWDVDV